MVGDSRPRAQGALAPLRRHPSRFAWLLLAIVVVALGIRVSYVAIAKAGPCDMRNASGKVVATEPSKCLQGDELFYNAEANYIADGPRVQRAVRRPLRSRRRSTGRPPTIRRSRSSCSRRCRGSSDHPPLSWVINEPLHDHVREDRYTMVVLGTRSWRSSGLLGRRVGGRHGRARRGRDRRGRAQLVGQRRARDVGDRHRAHGRRRDVVRVPARDRPTLLARGCARRALRSRRTGARRVRAVRGAARDRRAVHDAQAVERNGARSRLVAVVTALLVIAPWVGFNLARFHDPTFISTNDGITLAGANCDATYHGGGIGLWTLGAVHRAASTSPAISRRCRATTAIAASTYIKHHASRLPVVMLARVGRTWSLFRPVDMVSFNAGEDRERWVTRLGLYAYYPTLLFAIGGAVVLVATAGTRRALDRCVAPVDRRDDRRDHHLRPDALPGGRRAVARAARRGRDRRARRANAVDEGSERLRPSHRDDLHARFVFERQDGLGRCRGQPQ